MLVETPDRKYDAVPADLGLAGIIPGVIAPTELDDPLLLKGLALWNKLRGERAYPSRQQMSPRALGILLRQVILIKVLDGAKEFQIRIIGDGVLAVQSDPFQGLTTAEIDAMVPGYGDGLHQMYSHACEVKVPLAFRGRLKREGDGRVFHREHLLLPLGETDAAVDHLMSVVVYLQPPL